MTDAPDGPAEGEPRARCRRPPRVGDAGSPVGSTLSIVLAVIAVVAGFLILRAITDDDDDGDAASRRRLDDAGRRRGRPTSGRGDAPRRPAATDDDRAGPVLTGATVVVANASGIGGSAGGMTRGA